VPQAGYSKGPTITDKLTAVRLDFDHPIAARLFNKLQFVSTTPIATRITSLTRAWSSRLNPGGYGDIAFPGGASVAGDVGNTGLSFVSFSREPTCGRERSSCPSTNSDILVKTWTLPRRSRRAMASSTSRPTVRHPGCAATWVPQWVHSDQSAQGYRANVGSTVTLTNPAVTLSNGGTTYNDFLPALNLTGDLGNSKLLRWGFGADRASGHDRAAQYAGPFPRQHSG